MQLALTAMVYSVALEERERQTVLIKPVSWDHWRLSAGEIP
jgi:hypothetical protein